MLLFDSQNQIKLFLVMVMNIPAVRHVRSLLQSLFQLMERWESMPKWDLNYVLTERVDQGKGRQSGLHHVHLKPSLTFIYAFLEPCISSAIISVHLTSVIFLVN